MPSNQNVADELRWKKFPLLSDGFVCLVDHMGDDAAVAQAARVSYDRDARDGKVSKQSSDEDLLRFLMRHRHTTPFEMCELKILVRVPMDTWRQWIRHRAASVNEYSTRYTEAIDSQQTTHPEEWRLQATGNKQGSEGYLDNWPDGWSCIARDHDVPGLHTVPLWDVTDPDGVCRVSIPRTRTPACMGAPPTPGQILTGLETEFHEDASDAYQLRLALGVAREQARKDLPLSTYTEAYWKIDLHNLLHFLGLRMDSHAQQEIRQYATVIGEQIVAKLWPGAWAAFLDYRMGAVTLSALDTHVVHNLLGCGWIGAPRPDADWRGWPEGWRGPKRNRERDECVDKLQRLGLLSS